jgi:hypothetical protein
MDAHAEEDVLELPSEADARKTTVTTEEEIRREMAAHDANEGQVIEIPPLAETAPPASPKFNEPSLSPPSFGDLSTPPPSPFSQSEPGADRPGISPPGSSFSKSSPPIPSPFGEQKPAASDFAPASSTPFAEPEPFGNAPSVNPFDLPPDQQRGQAMAETDWTPPSVPQASWQDPGSPQGSVPPPAAGGVNQTLPIISLVLGIVSICCYISPITGIAALITGYKGMKNANNDPTHFGGKGLAIAGMITGGVFLLLGLLYWLYIIFVVGFAAMTSFMR